MAVSLARKADLRTVRDVMSTRVVTVVPEMTVGELVLTFLEEGVRGAPVLDPAGKLLGVVSEEDVMRLALPGTANGNGNGHGNGSADRIPVAKLMRAPAVVGPDEPLRPLLDAFLQEGVRRVLVLENDILLGIVTPVDALRGLAGEA
jgi:CBS domain-containing protein